MGIFTPLTRISAFSLMAAQKGIDINLNKSTCKGFIFWWRWCETSSYCIYIPLILFDFGFHFPCVVHSFLPWNCWVSKASHYLCISCLASVAQLARHMPKISIEVGLGRVEFFLDPKNVNKQRQEGSKIPSLRHPVDGFQGRFLLKGLVVFRFQATK